MATVKQLQNTLRLTFGVVPIVAGLDKFTGNGHRCIYIGAAYKTKS